MRNLRVLFILTVIAFAVSLIGQWNAAQENGRLRDELSARNEELTIAKHDLRAADDALGQCITYMVKP